MIHKTFTNAQKVPLWSHDFILLLLSNFFLWLGADLIIPVLPVYLIDIGATNSQIGIVMGCFTFSAILFRLFAFRISKYLGSRIFLMFGLLISAFATSGYYFTTILLLLFFLRVIHGLCFGAATTLFGALAANIIPMARMGEGMSYFGIGIVIAAAIGPFFGATIVLMPFYQWVFLLTSIFMVISFILTKLSHIGQEMGMDTKMQSKKKSTTDFFEKKALLPSCLTFFVGISFSGVFTFLVLFGKETGLEKSIGLFFLLTAVSEFLIRMFSGKLYDRKGHFVVLVPGASICLFGTVLLSISTTVSLFLTASILYGIGLGMIFPVLEAWAVKSVDSNRRVAATATFYNFLDAGIALGSFILGIVAQVLDFASMYMYLSLTFVLFLFIYFICYFSQEKRFKIIKKIAQ